MYKCAEVIEEKARKNIVEHRTLISKSIVACEGALGGGVDLSLRLGRVEPYLAVRCSTLLLWVDRRLWDRDDKVDDDDIDGLKRG